MSEWRTVTDISNDVSNPGEALARHANREGLEGRSLFSDERQERMEGGTKVHEVFDLLRAGEEVDPKSYEVKLRGYVGGLLAWHSRFERKILKTEVEVENPKTKVRGRIDVVRACTKEGCPCDSTGIVVLDGKIGKLVTYLPAHLQVAGYEYLWMFEERPQPVCGREILCVNAAGAFKVWEGLCTPEMFITASIWHEDLVPLRRAVNEQRDRR